MDQHELLNELPKYSEWPARLLGLKAWTIKTKTKDTVQKEYDIDKWGTFLQQAKHLIQPSLSDIDKMELGEDQESICWQNNSLVKLSAYRARELYKKIVAEEIQRQLPTSNIVELGAGFGSIILSLAQQSQFKDLNLFAGEFTSSGIELMNLIAKNENISISTGFCDLGSNEIAGFQIPQDAIIFTSMAIPYIQNLPDHFFERVKSLNPKVVLHFEPCFQHFDSTTYLGLMQQQYVKLNGYNHNFLTELYKAQESQTIQIISEKPLVFGENPFFPISIIAWKPK